MVSALVDRAPPLSLSKRYLRADGEVVHVDLLVSLFSDSNRLISTLSWGRRRETDLSPGRLWQAALHVKHVTGVRKLELGIDICSDYVHEIMIHIYLAEAEGRIVSLDQLCCAADLNTSTAIRWIRVLEQRGLVQSAGDRADAVQFTHAGLTKIERILGAMLQPLDTSLEWARST
jgi:predicted transcriptional regulator